MRLDFTVFEMTRKVRGLADGTLEPISTEFRKGNIETFA